jgi:zinc transporter 1/2/3
MPSITGGVIFGTALLHLMPDIAETFNEYQKKEDKDIDYPVMEVTIGFGFILIFLLEKGIGARHQERLNAGKMQSDDKDDGYLPEVTSKVGKLDHHPVSDMTTKFSTQAVTDRDDGSSKSEGTETGTVACECAKGYEMLALNPGIKEYAFAFALSLHSLIAGLVLGFFDEANKVFTLLIGLALHKIPVAIALVIQLFRGRVKWKTTAVIGLIFSLITPIGIAIGTAIYESGSTNTPSGMLAEAILQALGAGTLLYVVAMGILMTEFSTEDRHFQKCLCFLVGFLVIAAISFVPHKEHTDEHDELKGNSSEH